MDQQPAPVKCLHPSRRYTTVATLRFFLVLTQEHLIEQVPCLELAASRLCLVQISVSQIVMEHIVVQD